MNTLTLNRILQEGDEYLNGNNGAWTKVPENDFGLQIQFSTYRKTQVRRPSEAPPKTSTIQPISPDSERPEAAKPSATVTAKAESDESPVASHSATGDASYLPTVVSRKAHQQEQIDRDIIDKIPMHLPLTTGERAALDREIDREAHLKIKFNGITRDHPDRPIWTGRNGTFTGYGLEVMRVHGNNVMLTPLGKRGAGNGCIQIPISAIPQLVKWLNEQTDETAGERGRICFTPDKAWLRNPHPDFAGDFAKALTKAGMIGYDK